MTVRRPWIIAGTLAAVTVALGVAQHSLSAALRQQTVQAPAFEALVHVDHPGRHSPDTIDCASCHFATPTSRLVAKVHFGLDERSAPGAFTAEGGGVTAAELTATFDEAGVSDRTSAEPEQDSSEDA